MMRAIIAGAFFLGICQGCGNQKTTVDAPAATAQQEASEGFSTGRVTTQFAGEGCPLLVKVDGVDNLFLFPVGLEERYKRSGLQLRFKYRPSRANIGDCRKGEAAILEEITLPAPKAQRVLENQ